MAVSERETEAAPVVLGPDSIVWRRTGDWRLLFVGGRSLLLQVAHPAVAAGVSQYSNYMEDPWGRLNRTIDLFSGVLFDGPDSPATAARLRNLHKRIKGVDAHGQRYSALEPEAFHWVHATLVDGLPIMLDLCGDPLRGDELDRYYAEMCEIGRLYGVRDRDMPPDWAAFRAYFDDFVNTKLEDNDVVRNVLTTLASPPRPELPVPDALWRLVAWPGGRVGRLSTIGRLPEALRRRWGLEWTPAQERELRFYGALARRVFPLIPARLRLVGPAYAARQRTRATLAA